MSKTKPKTTKGIDSFFAKKPDVISHLKDEKIIEKIKDKPIEYSTKIIEIKKDKTIVEEFYDSLTPNETIAHELAEKMLGTSYDVMRTHGFLNWLKTKKSE